MYLHMQWAWNDVTDEGVRDRCLPAPNAQEHAGVPCPKSGECRDLKVPVPRAAAMFEEETV